MDYRLSFCSPNPSIQGNIQFQIIEYKTVAEYEETITWEEAYVEEEYDDYDDYDEEEYDDYDDYDDYGDEEEVVEEEEVEPEMVKVVTKKRVYRKVPVTIYDNQAEGEGGTQEYYHVSKKRTKIYVKVFIPGTEDNSSTTQSSRTVAYACVGLLLEHQPAPRLGFK